jgi:ABC-type polysaccharide/polyol phosphate transport system ATPase subunit
LGLYRVKSNIGKNIDFLKTSSNEFDFNYPIKNYSIDKQYFISDGESIKTDKQERNKLMVINKEDDKDTIGSKIHLYDMNREIKNGELIGIIGEVGSGKSSCLQAILNNMELLNKDHPLLGAEVIVNKKISFVSQNV